MKRTPAGAGVLCAWFPRTALRPAERRRKMQNVRRKVWIGVGIGAIVAVSRAVTLGSSNAGTVGQQPPAVAQQGLTESQQSAAMNAADQAMEAVDQAME